MFKDQETSKNPADQRQGGRQETNSGRENQQSAFNEAQSGALRELLLAELRDIYWAEQELVNAIPEMAEKASSEELKEALTNHLEETRNHVARLEKVFEALGEEAEAEECEAMAGLLEEAEQLVSEMPQDVVRDAAIIAAAQKIEHYEIATYGTLVAFAEILGETEAARHLQDTLEEEKNADSTLTDIAMSHVNPEAAGGRQGSGQEGNERRGKGLESEGEENQSQYGSKENQGQFGGQENQGQFGSKENQGQYGGQKSQNIGTHREHGHENPRGMKKEAGQSMDQDMLEEDQDLDMDQEGQQDEPISPKTSE